MGTTGLNAADRSRRDAEAFVNFSGIAHPGAGTRKKRVRAERSPLRTSRSPFRTSHNTRSPHPRHRTTTAETRGHLQLGLANSLFRTGSATPVPADGDFRAPAMRSTGFKTDLIPQPARVPPPNPRGLRRNFPQSWDALGRLRLQQSEVRRQKNVLGKGGGEGGRNGEEKVRLKPIGIGFLLAKEEVDPSPGVWWRRRRRRRRRRAPPRSSSTLWGGKAARNLPDPPLHPPPASSFPPPRSSRRLPPSSPKPAASTDLSNGCTFLGAGRGVAERLNPGRKARGSKRATPARRAPGSSAARSSGRGGEKGERGGECRTAPRRRSGAIPALCSPPPAAGQQRPHPPGPGRPSRPSAGLLRPSSRPGGHSPPTGSSWALKG
ncbi:splicing factor, proline- and glutamine-rich-like [Bos javanicus]|uniref:splicing factor, proline- and glutamine-rich-like n=1 Tax=Bos javanicus TaxID=9906 RepID=UPI002AA87EB5|nr:splicing factor, proline- and glutamine-rich-like [Bos javanicus]